MKDYEEYIFSKLPERYQEFIKRESTYAGYTGNVEKFIFWLLVAYIGQIVGVTIALAVIRPALWIVSIPLMFLISVGIAAPYIVFSSTADARRKDINDMLPDFLLLVAANIKSGLTIDRALLFSARPEFGDLSREFKKVAFEIYSGDPIEIALAKLTKRIKSEVLERTISLLVEGIKSGGAVAKLLEETAMDIRNTETLQKEIRASVMMYVMFIFMAAVLGAPMLFAISNFLILGTVSMWKGMSVTPSADMQVAGMIKISPPAVDTEMFGYFAVAAIIITTTFSGILISLIQSGNTRQGIKYSPLFTTVALIIFFAGKSILFRLFGGMLGV